jgi:hypothetical protein
MTDKKRSVLAYLKSGGPNEFLERGTPPYSATDVARALGLDPANTAKTLDAMERDGLVIREIAKREAWNAIAGRGMPRKSVCYWNAETVEQDREDVRTYMEGAAARSDAAFEAFAQRMARM